MGVAKKKTDFMIFSTQKFSDSVSFTRTEALKIHKYPHPGYFLWVATDPPMIQASKELHIILSRSLPGRLPGSRLSQRCNAVECNNGNALRNADVVHTRYVTLFCCVKVTSSHHDAWRMERDSFARSFDQAMT
jgi:hypothetical protein